MSNRLNIDEMDKARRDEMTMKRRQRKTMMDPTMSEKTLKK